MVRLSRIWTRTAGRAWVGLVLVAALMLPAPAQSAEVAPEVLAVGVEVERQPAAGETRAFLVELAAVQPVLVEVEQEGVDVVVSVLGPGGEGIAEVDSPVEWFGPERVLFVPAASGVHRVEVRAREGGAGSRSYRVCVHQPVGDHTQGRIRTAALAALTEAGRQYRQGTAEAWRGAIASYEEALGHWQELRQPRETAAALFCVAELHRQVDEHPQALECYREVLPLWQELNDPVKQAATLNGMGLSHWSLGEIDQARSCLEQALQLQQVLGHRAAEAATRNNLCLTHHARGELDAAAACYLRVIELAAEAGAPGLEAVARTNVGRVFDVLGEPQQALEHYSHALELARTLDDRAVLANAENNLGVFFRRMEEPQRALEHYRRSLEIFRDLGDRRGEARALSNMGHCLLLTGDPRRALVYLEQSLPLRRAVGDRRGEAATLNNLGLAHSSLGATGEAISCFEQALALRREAGDRRLVATALSLLGWGHAVAGENEAARACLAEALQRFGELGARREQALAQLRMGQVERRLGELEQARKVLGLALEGFRSLRVESGEAETLVALAAVERDLGRVAEAQRRAAAAIAIIEATPPVLDSPELRASYLAARHGAFELAVDLAIRRHEQDPTAGWELRALELSERSRARTLLDLLRRSGVELNRGVDSKLQRQLLQARRRLGARAARRLRLLAGEHTEDQARAADLEVDLARQDLDGLRAKVRGANPRFAALTRPELLSAPQIQALLDDDTLLLEYALGEHRSHLWAVTNHTVAVYPLPAREVVEAAARNLHVELSTLDPRRRRTEAEAVAQMLLGGVVDLLGARRVVVVADGALHYLPFAALPVPGTGEPLVVRSEVSAAPSASVLAAQRRLMEGRARAVRGVAVLADPVFDRDDPRVSGVVATGAGEAVRGPGLSDALQLSRLPSTRQEAAAIAAMLPADRVWVALGFEANREALLGQRMTEYQVIHLATHGLLDSDSPELSGLVLSLLDRNGNEVEGSVHLHDVYNLELGAELVVLSGCQTALGREIRGEGLVGLTRGLMYAGVPQVVASLWRVPDRVTTELMERFYRALVEDGARPAAALAAAQRSIREERRWRDPYYWAAFVHLGDWQSRMGDLTGPAR